ncbi:hypothetical protein JST97_17660 [bacterium]|nr:hypothetical protein [bacterium]
MDNDLQAIHQLVRQLYLAISFNSQSGPDWEVLRGHFWERGQLVRSGLAGIEYYSVEQFTEWVDQARANGLTSFQEEETDASTHLMGNLAHRASHYRATLDEGRGGTVEGINSMQILKSNGQWKVVSLLWDVPAPT